MRLTEQGSASRQQEDDAAMKQPLVIEKRSLVRCHVDVVTSATSRANACVPPHAAEPFSSIKLGSPARWRKHGLHGDLQPRERVVGVAKRCTERRNAPPG